ncbi:MAG: transketolase family protein [Candidatus Pacebacteria bacterium]|nr:transketolase family protein [Candidatus Paceibacterota bacterium]
MINKNLQLHPDTLYPEKLDSKPIRNGFGSGLVEAGKNNKDVVVLCADLAESTRVEDFKKEFPDRYVEVGVAEQNLATVASGIANYGKIPFITSYASFSPGRNNEQIRTTIALNDVPVKIAGSHAGLSVGPDGATHQALEDIGLMRMLPNMTVIVPADIHEAYRATVAATLYPHPVYIRLGRANSPVFTTTETPFEIGKAQILFDSLLEVGPLVKQVGIIACGTVVHPALLAAQELSDEGIFVTVMNMATIKPMDANAVIELAKKTGAIVTVEEHQKAGGMGSAVAEILVEHFPVPMEIIGVDDQFGQSGTPEELMKHYGLDKDAIKQRVKKLLERK